MEKTGEPRETRRVERMKKKKVWEENTEMMKIEEEIQLNRGRGETQG